MYKPIYDYLIESGYTVHSEVSHCDIAAVKGEELLVVEMKKSLNLAVIMQAALRQKLADLVYVAVPKPGRELFSNRWKNIYYLLKRLHLGLIFVSLKEDCAFIDIAFEPAPFDMASSKQNNNKKKRELIKEFNARHGDFNTGGSTGKKLVTAYKEQAIHIACCLIKYGPMSPRKLRELGTDEKKTTAILGKDHYGWFEHKSINLYDINEKGRKEVEEHKELYAYYMHLLNEHEHE